MLILQEQLEEKDSQLEKLKEELEQKTQMEAERIDSAPDRKISGDDATMAMEAGNWAVRKIQNFGFSFLSVH